MKKIAGVSVWTWAAGMGVALAAVAAIGQAMDGGNGNGKPKEAATKVAVAAGKEKPGTEVEALGQAALQEIQLRTWAVDSVATCETDLEKQTLPGKAALASIALNEAKGGLAKGDAKMAAALEMLKAKGVAGGILASQLTSFSRYSDEVIREYNRARRFDGYTPEARELHIESLRTRAMNGDGVSLDDVRRGGYESEVMRRVKAAWQEEINRMTREALSR
jgi:hypothetical protein